MWDGYGLFEATWEPMSAFIQPDGSIKSIFRSYLVEDNEGQLLTHAETVSQLKRKANLLVSIYERFSNLPGAMSTPVLKS